ncbi:MAG: HAD family hydrolase [Pseudomonadales bacterium]
MAIQGVFFDLGGTLFSYSGMAKSTGPLLLKAVQQLGVQVSLPDIGRAYRQASAQVGKQYGALDYYLHADLFRDTFVQFSTLLGCAFDPSIYEWYRHAQHEAVLGALELRADCRNTLAELRSKGLYLSIVSNIDDDMLHPLIEREQLQDYLHHWSSSEEAQSCKPHSAFFEYSLGKSGLAAEDVLFVGDSPEHDVLGASSMGMKTVLISAEGLEAPLQSGKPTVPADFNITNLSELLELADLPP